jgi:uncharacterized protein (DUF2267 family)
MPETQIAREMGEVRRSFVREVARRSPLPADVTVEAATTFVTCTFAERLTRGAAHEMLDALPDAISVLLRPRIEQWRGPPSTLDRPELVSRTADWLGVTPKTAERICSGILSVVREWLPPLVVEHIYAQLPADLEDLWFTTPDREAVPSPSWEPDVLKARVFAEIERAGVLPPNVDVADAFMAVMCIVSQRLSGGEARHVLLGLPSALRPLVTTCMLHRAEWAERFDRDDLLRRVAEHLRTSPSATELVVRAVLRAVKQCLPEKDVEDTASQLPHDLGALWLDA